MDAKEALKHHKTAEADCADLAIKYLKTKDYTDAARWAYSANAHKFAARQIKLVFKGSK